MTDAPIQPIENSPAGEIPVRGYLHLPANASGDALVLTHGAGSNANAPLLVALATAFAEAAVTVLRCDLPFRQLRPHGPPQGDAERDQQGLRRAIEWIRQQARGRLFLGGHSYGGRQSSILAAAAPGLADALLLLSYPLHPPKNPAQLRTTHFPRLRTPALFVHGTRDGFATLDELTDARRLIPAPTELLAIDPAGHELLTAGNRGTLPRTIATAFAAFLSVGKQATRGPDDFC